MCDTCGCNLTPGNKHLAFKPVAKGATAVSVLKGLLAKNDDQAAHNREHFDKRGIHYQSGACLVLLPTIASVGNQH